jgi:hypothetical protein
MTGIKVKGRMMQVVAELAGCLCRNLSSRFYCFAGKNRVTNFLEDTRIGDLRLVVCTAENKRSCLYGILLTLSRSSTKPQESLVMDQENFTLQDDNVVTLVSCANKGIAELELLRSHLAPLTLLNHDNLSCKLTCCLLLILALQFLCPGKNLILLAFKKRIWIVFVCWRRLGG